ncbi:GGDEF domain-containing protein [Deinococcus hohokamensis]|uniref:GGDEF domain-containing protein n=1 Tax=Deinococcus hohokamensis TaxID=309883 RepID=A0ABV9I656_9DEIO
MLAAWIYVLFWLPPYPAAQQITGVFALGWTALTVLAFGKPHLLTRVSKILLGVTAGYFSAILVVALYVERIESWPFDFLTTVPLLFMGVMREYGLRWGLRLNGAFIVLLGLIFLPALWGHSAAVDTGLAHLVASRFVLGSVLFLTVMSGTERFLARQVQARTIAEVRAQQALLDPLTGLANRRAFTEQTPSLLAASEDMPCALMIVDVDHFKSINDQYGHEMGDEVLRAVAGRLHAAAGEQGVVYRVAGDEFVIVVPGADQGPAVQVAQRVVQAFVTALKINEVELALTVSVGVAVAPTQGQTLSVLMKAADQSLYDVKRRGRNDWQYAPS